MSLSTRPNNPSKAYLKYATKKDYPILYTAIVEDVDVFITGDEDFDEVVIDKPEIMTAAEFIAKY